MWDLSLDSVHLSREVTAALTGLDTGVVQADRRTSRVTPGHRKSC